jgi:hypothetical protein
VFISDQCDDIPCSIQQGLAVLASAKVELEPLLQFWLDIVIHKVGDLPPNLDATDLDDCFSFQHDLWVLCPLRQ